MALPTNKIKKVKLPNNTEYEIIPSRLQGTNSAGTTSYEVSLPVLSSDDSFVTLKTSQTITGTKTFSNSVTVRDTLNVEDGYLNILNDAGSTYTGDDWDTSFKADCINIFNNNSSEYTTLLFPEFAGETKTIAVTDDIVSVEIVDLTSLAVASN